MKYLRSAPDHVRSVSSEAGGSSRGVSRRWNRAAGHRGVQRVAWWSALIVAGTLTAMFTVLVGTSQAAPCPDTNYNTVGRPDTNGRGNRVGSPGMYIYNNTITCARVSSIFVLNSSDTRFVEVGWYENPGDVFFCIPTTSGPPKQLAYATTTV